MKIVSTQYTLSTKTFEIYVSGCDGICGKQCHNYELRDFDLGEDYDVVLPKIISKIKDSDSMIENIWILGGEPLLQDKYDLTDMVSQLKLLNKKMWLFTRFELEEIKEIYSEYKLFDYIKCGKYISNLIVDNNIQNGIKLATSNQYIIEVK